MWGQQLQPGPERPSCPSLGLPFRFWTCQASPAVACQSLAVNPLSSTSCWFRLSGWALMGTGVHRRAEGYWDILGDMDQELVTRSCQWPLRANASRE